MPRRRSRVVSNQAIIVRVMLISVPVVAGIIAGCASARSEQTAGLPAVTSAPAPVSSAADSSTALRDEDYVAQANDFVNVHDMTPVRGFFLDNRLGHLDEALRVASSPDGGVYPVGTVIQLVPQEAMVKRKAGFAPDLGDWEFFSLRVSPEGTEIKTRGTADIKNLFNQSCGTCHMKADIKFDMVCEKNHGCDPLPLPDEFFKKLQETDPRPRRAAH